MGPDEFATREELGLVLKLMLAKIRQQAEMISTLASMVRTSGAITEQQFQDLIAQVAESPNTVRAKKADANLREFLAIRKIAKQYLDPPEE